jgi:hypothetical protein
MTIPSVSTSAGGGTSLRDVACPSPTSCFAVGTSRSSGVDTTLIERWNGTTWSIVPSPNPSGSPVLLSVACASDTSCFAVGQYSGTAYRTLVLRWNGTSWSIVPSPNPAGALNSALLGIACMSTTSCFAVGSADSGITPRTLIERWNGTSWSIVASPSPAGDTFPSLWAVSCPSATSCFAAGSYDGNNSTTKSLVERWNGTSWSIVASPNPAGATNSWLKDLSCPSTTSCYAVGSVRYDDASVHTLIERWNGTSWAVSTSPNPDPTADELLGVACMSTTSCFAVGVSANISTPGIIARWNGTSWSLAAHPEPTPPNNTLAAVSCPTANGCFGVGHYTTSSGTIATLVERPNGTGWSTVPSANPAGDTHSQLAGVSCPSATVCFAVGTSGVTRDRTLVERWNGSTWSIVASPNKANSLNRLKSVSCTSATSCVAVGNYDDGTIKTLVERLNGTAWSIVASPNPAGGESNLLESVSCPSATSCIAVGQYLDQPVTYSKTLVEHWNGVTWSIVASPNPPGAKVSRLSGVTCPSATSCFAVGDSLATTAATKSLIERWNGATWSIVASADRASATHSSLSRISCPSATSCFAVGGDHGSSGQYETLVKALSGTTWSIVASPNPTGATDAFLRDVSCPSTTGCFAVGDYDRMSAPRTLVERYS